MTDEKTRLTVAIPSELHAELERAALERGLPVAYLVRAALADFLPRLIPPDELTLVRPAGESFAGAVSTVVSDPQGPALKANESSAHE
jgi:hypothetical protein